MGNFTLKQKAMLMCGSTISLMSLAIPAFAVGEPVPVSVVDTITTEVAGLKTQALTVIAAGIGLSVVFFGAKLLWNKFRSMAK